MIISIINNNNITTLLINNYYLLLIIIIIYIIISTHTHILLLLHTSVTFCIEVRCLLPFFPLDIGNIQIYKHTYTFTVH